jgi:hypothetical protein
VDAGPIHFHAVHDHLFGQNAHVHFRRIDRTVVALYQHARRTAPAEVAGEHQAHGFCADDQYRDRH